MAKSGRKKADIFNLNLYSARVKKYEEENDFLGAVSFIQALMLEGRISMSVDYLLKYCRQSSALKGLAEATREYLRRKVEELEGVKEGDKKMRDFLEKIKKNAPSSHMVGGNGNK